MVSGASVKKDRVISKSSVSTKSFLIIDEKNGKLKLRENLGYIASENQTNHD